MHKHLKVCGLHNLPLHRYDFQQNTSAEKVQENIIKNTTAGSIIVLHNNAMSFKNIYPILAKTIQQLKKEGYSFSATW